MGDKYIPVNQLSSGEKRRALVDLAFAFLCEDSKHVKNIILAIDEPEISLHISACFEQFEKLKDISENNHQVLLTTHWYGFLPVIYSGYAHNTYNEVDKIIFKTYSLENFREEIILNKKRTRGELPFDIFLKSTNDLVQSIISSLRTDVFYNYIFCEGSSDYIYLKYYLNEYIKTNRLRILPLAGWGEISKIMKTISLALNEKEDEIKGKILAIIDTDKAGNRIENFNETDHLYFKRMIFNEEINNIILLPINSSECGDTSIEDVLNPNAFIETLKYYRDSPYYTTLKDEPINTDALCSYNVYNYRMSEKKQLKDFFKGHNRELKVEFAKKYVSLLATYDKIPKVFVDIIKLLNLNINVDNKENYDGIQVKKNNDSEIKQPDQKKKIVIVKRK